MGHRTGPSSILRLERMGQEAPDYVMDCDTTGPDPEDDDDDDRKPPAPAEDDDRKPPAPKDSDEDCFTN